MAEKTSQKRSKNAPLAVKRWTRRCRRGFRLLPMTCAGSALISLRLSMKSWLA